MDRAEASGFGVALAGHALLLGALSMGFANAVKPPIMNEPMEVSFVEEVGLQAAVPEPAETPATSVAPEAGAPEEAAPVEAPKPPEPVPPLPKPQPQPVAKPESKPVPKPEPKPVPKQVPRPVAKAAPAKPEPKPLQKQAAKPAPKAAAPTTPPKKKPAAAASGSAEATRGSRLGKDFLKGLGSEPSLSRSQKPTGAVMSAIALSGIKSAIERQIQPCADRQVNPGPGANRIQTTLNLRLNPNGSLAARPSVVRQSGIDDENGRYKARVADLAIAAFVGCAPLKGLPEELYQTAKGGWSNINMNYRLPG